MAPGKVLQFKRPSTLVDGLKLLYVFDDFAYFRIRKDQVEVHFSLDVNGSEEEGETYALYNTPEVFTEIGEEDFDLETVALYERAKASAVPIAKEQLRAFKEYSPGEKIKLHKMWYEDIASDLEVVFKDLVAKGVRDNLDELRDIAEELNELSDLIGGLDIAYNCL